MARRSSGSFAAFGLLAAVALIVVAVGLALRGPKPRADASPAPTASDRYPNAWPEPPPAEVSSLLGDLGPGASLGTWRVRGVSPVHEQRIVVDVERGEVGFRVAIERKATSDKKPPKATERYALFTVQPRPSAEALDDADYAEVLDALAARLTQTEARVPTPAGL